MSFHLLKIQQPNIKIGTFLDRTITVVLKVYLKMCVSQNVKSLFHFLHGHSFHLRLENLI